MEILRGMLWLEDPRHGFFKSDPVEIGLGKSKKVRLMNGDGECLIGRLARGHNNGTLNFVIASRRNDRKICFRIVEDHSRIQWDAAGKWKDNNKLARRTLHWQAIKEAKGQTPS